MISLGRKTAGLAAALWIAASATSHAAPLETRATSSRTHLDRLTYAAKAPAGTYGYILMDAASGEVLSARNADRLFIPASLAKIPTTLATLAALGSDRRFETRLVADGAVIGGVLQGDLHLVGSGDPSLKTRDLGELASKLAARGITSISGRFTFDPSALPRTSAIDAAQPANQPYNPAVSGLNIDMNLAVRSGRRIPVRKPARRAARLLRVLAARQGIALPEPQRLRGKVGGTDIASHVSAPVSTIAARMMAKSTNLTAESLGALAARGMGIRPRSLGEAAEMTCAWVKSEAGSIGGSGWDGFRMVNHSGLSTRSRATPRQMAEILRLGYRKFGRAFTEMHRESAPAGYKAYTLRGKFGTMRFVRGYGGFLTIGGRDMVFTIMANDGHRRALADAGAPGLRSGAWMTKARRLESAILSDWLTDHWPNGTGDVMVARAEPVRQVAFTSGGPILADMRSAIPVDMTTAIASSPRYVRATSTVD